MIVKAPAKINLALDILGKDKNGYHLIDTIFQIIPVFDIISIKKSSRLKIKFKGEEGAKVDNKKNTVQQVFDLLKNKIKNSYEVIVQKNIPVGAGLGGGSSDAAAVIKALNNFERLNMSTDEMRKIGAKIGADVPCFIKGKTMLGTHYGEKITVLPDLDLFKKWKNLYKLLIVPDRRKKTKNVYAKVNLKKCGHNRHKTKKIIQGLKNRNFIQIISNIHNDFCLLKEGPLKALLCGSGTAVFAISNSPFDLSELCRVLQYRHIQGRNPWAARVRFLKF
ncbi:4-(cytidine 5'-diphospho)-2-C-methyl-D-erythritol kinase [Candidatus Peregrinibacteria bacterium]|nr:4-(cytidine 5'-diphospho)-2-C-methyl-D-erythritol kinase [Candidatus Peregrinibacteria bacterium]